MYMIFNIRTLFITKMATSCITDPVISTTKSAADGPPLTFCTALYRAPDTPSLYNNTANTIPMTIST